MCIATMQMHLHLLGGCSCPDWKPWSSALLRSCILLLVLVVGKTALWNVPVRQQSRTWQVRRSRGHPSQSKVEGPGAGLALTGSTAQRPFPLAS